MYGVDDSQWASILVSQLNRCAICRKPFSRSRPPAADHSHYSGLVRGALCLPCNDTIGRLHEDTQWLSNALDYLRDPPAVHAIGEVYVPNSPGAAGHTEEKTG